MTLRLLVTAVGGGVGQSILRALKSSNLKMQVYGTDIDPWSAGLYSCDKGFLVYPASHPLFAEKVLDICKSEGINVLIPGSDPEIPYLAKIKDDFISFGILPILGDSKSVQICRDKQKAYKYFSNINLPFIKTLRLNNSEDYSQISSKDFPLIIKPFDGSASRDVHVVFNKNDLERLKSEKQNDYIVQEYLIPECWGLNKSALSKNDVLAGGRLVQKDELSIQVLLDEQGIPFAKFTSLNVLKDGVPVYIEPKIGLEVENVAWQMASALGEIGLRGPCNLQCRITENGVKFFEINPRFTGITAVRALLGFNEVEAIIRLFYFKENKDDIVKNLSYSAEKYCSRYITEYIFNKTDFTTLSNSKKVEARGFSNNL